jgi:hypothetical protein
MKMTLPLAALSLAVAMPFAASAQAGPGAGGPPPEMRARMLQMRDDAHKAAFNDLTPAHRTQVQAIVDQVNSGKLTDFAAAANQINAILTPDETKAVIAEHEKAFAAMHRDASGGAPPGAQSTSEKPRPQMDAGHFLLLVSVSPDRMRDVMRGMHDHAASPAPQ